MSQKHDEKDKVASHRVIDTATSGTSYLILIQLASRILTFAGNQILLRFLTPVTLGIALQLDLYSVTVLYFSRESLRVALQRQPFQEPVADEQNAAKIKSIRSKQAQTVVNASYVAIGIGLPLAVILATVYSQKGLQEVLDSPFFKLSLVLYGVATVLELLAEPAFVIIQQRGLYKARAASETAAASAKCFAACLAAFIGKIVGVQVGVLPFAVGQLAYGNTVLFGYLISVYTLCKHEGVSIILKPIPSSPEIYWYQRFSRPLLTLALSMYVQSGVKQLLTQADSVILVALSSLEDQGAFALASNYGGLVARIIFQPIEESSRNAFGRLLAPNTLTTTITEKEDSPGKDKPNTNTPSSPGINAALHHLTTVLHFYSLLSIFAFCYAPYLLPLIVKYIIGTRWFSTEVASLLSSYAIYIPFMAFNGITEAFVSSVATTAELRGQAVWMAGFTAIFAGSAWVFLRALGWGAAGLVGANAANMALRTGWSWWFVTRWAAERGEKVDVKTVMPGVMSIATGVAVAGYLRQVAVGDPGLLEFGVMIAVCAVGGVVM